MSNQSVERQTSLNADGSEPIGRAIYMNVASVIFIFGSAALAVGCSNGNSGGGAGTGGTTAGTSGSSGSAGSSGASDRAGTGGSAGASSTGTAEGGRAGNAGAMTGIDASGASTGSGGSSTGAGGAPDAGNRDAGGASIGGEGGAALEGGRGGGTATDAGADGRPLDDSGLSAPWDWTGVVGTGQSLAVGQAGVPVKATAQPYGNLKMSTGTAAWPLDPNDTSFRMVPLVEPIGRLSTAFPSSYPTNIAGETPHTAMADQITAMVRAAGRDYVGVHGEFGENGQCLSFLVMGAQQVGVNGHAYQGTIIETTAITRLAHAQNKTYGVGAITVTHGECDAGNTLYETQLFQLWSDYNTDLRAITGQTQSPLMIVSQQNSINDRSASTLAQWRIGVDHAESVVCSGPKYQYPYSSADFVHLLTDGYEQLGEKYGQVYYERVVLGHTWQPLQPTTVERTGQIITVHFHVPIPPLVWDTVLPQPNRTVAAWSAGKGFEIRAGNNPVTISSVAITGDSVQITVGGTLPATGVIVGYAMTAAQTTQGAQVTDGTGALLWNGTFRWGQLRDSDPFVGSVTRRAQPNYAVAFEMPVP